MLEVKCPYSMAEKTPEGLCNNENFSLVNSRLQLSKNHQVQLELYVASDKTKCCDFCVFTLKGVRVERIEPDKFWEQQIVPQLDEYYFKHILPQLLYPQCKQAIIFKIEIILYIIIYH